MINEGIGMTETQTNNYSALIGKNVKVFLKNRHCYTGQIKSVEDNSILFLDKFGLKIVMNVVDISIVVEQNGGRTDD
tara:strand:- start:646 stop:876 length:231 start_codon:yes stop_codon:yes gene_type:complete